MVAVDVEAAICGAVVASKFPGVGKVVPHVRPGVGAFCTQHHHNQDWGSLALDLLEQGYLPETVLGELLRNDDKQGKRQLAIIDILGRVVIRNPVDADEGGIWWGAVSGRYYACQGNTLTGGDVVTAMAVAYEDSWRLALGERLMAALKAGDDAGGDHRGRLAAGLRLARSEASDGGVLALDVDESETAVGDLFSLFESQRNAR